MREQFASMLYNEMKNNDKIIIVSADIGYGIMDKIRASYPDRFINVGAAENLMIGVAIGLSYEGFLPICYTITPFLLYRPFEMIRNYVDYENLNIKLVGSGRDKDYSHDGFTHWAEDDIDVMQNCFKNFKLYKPEQLSEELFLTFLNDKSPGYLNLRRV